MNYEGLESQSTSHFKGTSSTDTHTSPTNHHASKSFPFLFFCYRLYMFTSSHDFEVKSVHFRARDLHFVIKLKIGKMFSNCAFKRPLTSTVCEKRELSKVPIFWEGHKKICPSVTFYLTLLSNVKLWLEEWANSSGLLRISELRIEYLENVSQNYKGFNYRTCASITCSWL